MPNFASQQIDLVGWLDRRAGELRANLYLREHKVGAGQIAPSWTTWLAQSAAFAQRCGAGPIAARVADRCCRSAASCSVQLLLALTGIVPVLDGLLVDPDG